MRKILAAALVVAACSGSSFAGAGFMVNYSVGDGTPAPGIAFTLGLTNSIYVNLGASFELSSETVDTAEASNSLSFGVIPSLSFYLKKTGDITPYIPVGVSIGADFAGGEMGKLTVAPYSGFGIEWSVNDNIGVWGEADLGYSFANEDATKTVTHEVTLGQSGVGITFYF